jgi:hypothetical protein
MKKLLFISLMALILNTSGFSQCDSITIFPWFEGFENNNDSLPDCWSQDMGNNGWDSQHWNVVSNNHFTGIPPTSHSGEYKIFISLDCGHDSQHRQDLVLPPFDISGLANPTLTFWHANNGRGILALDYKSSKDQELWHGLHGYYYYVAENWTKVIVSLPNKSNYYQIAFIGHHFGGGYGYIQIDDISISDGPLSISSNQTPDYHVSPNPVQDQLNISGNNIALTSLYDVQGRLVYSDVKGINAIDMSNFPNGLYFLKILSTNGTIFTQKILKQ